MPWKVVGIPLAEFVGGLVTLRIALPIESIVLTGAGLVLTLVGIGGLTRHLAKPQHRPYVQE